MGIRKFRSIEDMPTPPRPSPRGRGGAHTSRSGRDGGAERPLAAVFSRWPARSSGPGARHEPPLTKALLAAIACAVSACAPAPAHEAAPRRSSPEPPEVRQVNGPRPRLGFTLFPYDVRDEAVERTRAFVLEHGDTVLFHHDHGVPWAEALAGAPYPDGTEARWRAERARIPEGHAVVLAITPTADDRESLAEGALDGASPTLAGEVGKAPDHDTPNRKVE